MCGRAGCGRQVVGSISWRHWECIWKVWVRRQSHSKVGEIEGSSLLVASPWGIAAWVPGCLHTCVHVHAHACACCLAELLAGALPGVHSLLQCQESGAVICSSSPHPPSSFPYPELSRLSEKHCIQALGHFPAASRAWGLVPLLTPFLVPHALAAVSWALTEKQGQGCCGACSGWRELDPPIPFLSRCGTLVPTVFPMSGTILYPNFNLNGGLN